jgi:hypothetical protein
LHFGIFADLVFFTGNGEEKSSAGENEAGASCEGHEEGTFNE